MTDSERIAALETEVRNMKELFGEKLDMVAKSVADLQQPRGVNWTALSVCLGGIGMICSFAFVWLKTNLQPLEMNVAANRDQIATVLKACEREHVHNWDNMKVRVDNLKAQVEQQNALIRILVGEKVDAYEKRVNPTGRN